MILRRKISWILSGFLISRLILTAESSNYSHSIPFWRDIILFFKNLLTTVALDGRSIYLIFCNKNPTSVLPWARVRVFSTESGSSPVFVQQRTMVLVFILLILQDVVHPQHLLSCQMRGRPLEGRPVVALTFFCTLAQVASVRQQVRSIQSLYSSVTTSQIN